MPLLKSFGVPKCPLSSLLMNSSERLLRHSHSKEHFGQQGLDSEESMFDLRGRALGNYAKERKKKMRVISFA
jgi:hypothetical protein